uniref:Uncharacterized protein n=1 Tax=Rhizophora mucronata TaxID=61149 RepID=A0A2P2Q2V1_RHIMU
MVCVHYESNNIILFAYMMT